MEEDNLGIEPEDNVQVVEAAARQMIEADSYTAVVLLGQQDLMADREPRKALAVAARSDPADRPHQEHDRHWQHTKLKQVQRQLVKTPDETSRFG